MTDFARLVLDADTRGLKTGERDLGSMSNTARKTAGEVDKSSRSITTAFVRVGGAIASAVAVSGGIGAIVRTNAEFGSSMQRVAAISGATAGELEELRATALKMGADTAFSASQAADALGFLAMAGFSASEAMEAIPDVLALAAASGMELAEAADIASNVISGFGKEAAEAAQVSDVLALAASKTNTNVSQLGQAMSTAAPIAAALGISMEETAAAIGVMSDAGIQGERAGTALRGVFASLAGPTTQAQEALAKYGLTAADIDPQTVGLAEAMGTLAERGLTTADAMIIFGREAASGALVMAGMAERIGDLTGEFENAEGAAGEMAAIMRDNLTGDIDELTGSLETMIITLGDSGVTGAMRNMAQAGTAAINLLSTNMGTLISVVSTGAAGWAAYRLVLLAGAAASGIASSALVAQASAIAAASARLGILGSVTTAATVATRGLTAALVSNPFTAVAVAVGVLAAAMVNLGNAQRQARAETDNLVRSLRGLAQARAADFGARRAEVDLERQRLEGQLAANRAEQQRVSRSPELAQRGGASARLRGLQNSARDLTWQIIEMEGELSAADQAFEKAESAAESMQVPVAQTATAISGLGTAMGSVGGATKTATVEVDKMRGILARAFPEMEQYRRLLEDFAIIQASDLSDTEKGRTRRALIAANDDNDGEFGFLTGPQDDLKKANADLGLTTEELRKKVGLQTVQIAKSFGDMAQDSIRALQQLQGAIQGGGFLDILGGLLNIGLQLGSAGVFGKSIATNINRPAPTNRSMGGMVYAGQSYVVGENGPERFTPPGAGRIHSNDNMGGGSVHVTFGVDGSGNITPFVNGQIATAAPLIANAGASQAGAQSARSARRTIRR